MTQSVVHGNKILGYDGLTTLSVRIANGILYRFNRLLARQNSAYSKETGLHDRIDAAAHPYLTRDLVRIDQVELDSFLETGFLHRLWQAVPYLVCSKRRVQQKRGARFSTIQNVHALEKLELVAGYEAGLGDQVGRPDWARAETQMRHRGRPGLFRVIYEI